MSGRSLEDVIQTYFDALYLADPELMEGVLHPAAVYATADEERPLIRRVPDYLAVLSGREAPADRGEARRDEVVWLEQTGEKTAIAKLRCAIGDRRFTDYLSFIRTDSEWRIIAKVFAFSVEKEVVASCHS